MSRSILDNPKALATPALLVGTRDGALTARWRARVRRYYRSVIPAHIPAERQLWVSTPEDLGQLVEQLKRGNLDLSQTEYICVLEPVSDIYDIADFLTHLRRALPEQAKVLCYIYNWWWWPFFRVGGLLALSRRRTYGGFYRRADFRSFVDLSGWDTVKESRRYVLPAEIPVVSLVLDRFLFRLPFLRALTLNSFFVLRTLPARQDIERSVSVVVPCRNEEGNIQATVTRMPRFGSELEIVFVDDASTDGTRDRIVQAQSEHPDKKVVLALGKGKGKAEAVREGMKAASGDICMILDADLTVLPEDLPQFYYALRSGRAEFVHGTRFVYEQERESMRFANVIGNVFFSRLFSFILDQRTTDTLCGTKAFWRRDWPAFEQMRGQLGKTDLWGDYNLIFGASQYGLKTAQLPVRYFERLEGLTKMTRRLRNGLTMSRVAWHAMWKLKFGR